MRECVCYECSQVFYTLISTHVRSLQTRPLTRYMLFHATRYMLFHATRYMLFHADIKRLCAVCKRGRSGDEQLRSGRAKVEGPVEEIEASLHRLIVARGVCRIGSLRPAEVLKRAR